jgi:four helix bundle protein
MDDLKEPTKKFALDVIRFCSSLPNRQEFWVINRQLVKCATSVGANYRSSRRAKSSADFIAKLSVVEEEADECMYWLELLSELTTWESKSIRHLHCETNELTSIFVQSKKTARSRSQAQSGSLRTSNFAPRTSNARP